MNDNTKEKNNLVFSSWNVRGVNNPVRRGKALSHLKSLTSDIMFLQETHLNNKSCGRLRIKWIGEIYHSTPSSKARGAAILIRKGVPVLQKKTITNREGHYVIVVGEIQSTSL